MNNTTYKYLLKKYALSNNSDDLEYKSTLSDILHRLNKDRRLNNTDKKWLENKQMINLLGFIDHLEMNGQTNFNLLHKNSDFPCKDYMAPPIIKEIIKPDVKLMDNSGNLDENENIDTSPIKENKKKTNRKKQNTSKNKTKLTIEKTTGHNIRKPHMALHYKQARIAEHIKTKVINLKPTNIPEDISSLFLPKIWETINSDIQKDITELYKAYKYSLWTSTILMAYRILENILKVHIKSDLKTDPGNSITKSIQILEKNKYASNLLKKLSEYKDERNEYMHGNKRAGAGEVKKIVGDIISITMHIHNIKP